MDFCGATWRVPSGVVSGKAGPPRWRPRLCRLGAAASPGSDMLPEFATGIAWLRAESGMAGVGNVAGEGRELSHGGDLLEIRLQLGILANGLQVLFVAP